MKRLTWWQCTGVFSDSIYLKNRKFGFEAIFDSLNIRYFPVRHCNFMKVIMIEMWKYLKLTYTLSQENENFLWDTAVKFVCCQNLRKCDCKYSKTNYVSVMNENILFWHVWLISKRMFSSHEFLKTCNKTDLVFKKCCYDFRGSCSSKSMKSFKW